VQEGELNLGTTQTKRVQVIDNTVALGAQLDVTLNTAGDPCNIHGLILDIWVGQQVATFHDFGNWALMLLPRGASVIPSLTTTSLNNEKNNPVMWMNGNWMLVDLDRNHVGGAPRTSRNCPRDGRLVFSLENSAISQGAVRVHGVATWFETIK